MRISHDTGTMFGYSMTITQLSCVRSTTTSGAAHTPARNTRRGTYAGTITRYCTGAGVGGATTGSGGGPDRYSRSAILNSSSVLTTL